MAPLIKLNGQYVGADKIGHFFAEGYSYYWRAEIEKQSLEEVLLYGDGLEAGFYGAANTGIKSYGDLTANYRGYLFWKNLLEADEATGRAPLFVCARGRYALAGTFSAAAYVDAAWDEGINCSEYAHPDMEVAVDRRIAEVAADRGEAMVCPMSAAQCQGLTASYGELAPHLLSARCRNAGH
jgi:hypothetical protein